MSAASLRQNRLSLRPCFSDAFGARVVCAHEAPDSAAAAGLFSGLQSWT